MESPNLFFLQMCLELKEVRMMPLKLRPFLFIIITMLLLLLFIPKTVLADISDKPVITSVHIASQITPDSTKAFLTIKAISVSPITSIRFQLLCPDNSMESFNCIIKGGFNKTPSGEWEYTHTTTVLKNAIAGRYIYNNIRVGNTNMVSDIWPEEVGIDINTSDDKPVITAMSIANQETIDGFQIAVSVRAKSVSQVNWLNRDFYGPEGLISSVGAEVHFAQVSPEVFEYTWTDTISRYDSSGKYYYSNICIENERQIQSDFWPNELGTEINTYSYERVVVPVAYPKGGSLPTGTIVKLTSETPDATIYYTTDGSTPLTPSTVSFQYSEPIIVHKAMTIKAIAVKDGMVNSPIMNETYTLYSGGGGGGPSPPVNIVARPIAEPSYQEVSIGSQVFLSTVTADANIYYTLDGSEPVPGRDGTLLYDSSNPITINQSCILKVVAEKTGMNNSAIKTVAYTLVQANKVNYKVYINGTEIQSDAGFYESEGVVLASLKCLAEAMGLQVTWSPVDQQVKFLLGSISLVMTTNNSKYVLNGVEIEGLVSPIIVDGGIFAPAQSVVESFGGKAIVEKPQDECFIATAAYGSKFQPCVTLLRQFRDKYLLTNNIGTSIVQFYYRHSPPIARFISQSEGLRAITRVLLTPFVMAVYCVFHPGWASVIFAIVFIVAIIFTTKRRGLT
ncbi:MAG: hypothetical protein GXY49_11120 [Syntrophomonadaceae bacterium]|nr:hypothetical protein [Syntrophomonadaceae bacterium]